MQIKAPTRSPVSPAALEGPAERREFMGFVVFLCGRAWHKHNIGSILNTMG